MVSVLSSSVRHQQGLEILTLHIGWGQRCTRYLSSGGTNGVKWRRRRKGNGKTEGAGKGKTKGRESKGGSGEESRGTEEDQGTIIGPLVFSATGGGAAPHLWPWLDPVSVPGITSHLDSGSVHLALDGSILTFDSVLPSPEARNLHWRDRPPRIPHLGTGSLEYSAQVALDLPPGPTETTWSIFLRADSWAEEFTVRHGDTPNGITTKALRWVFEAIFEALGRQSRSQVSLRCQCVDGGRESEDVLTPFWL